MKFDSLYRYGFNGKEKDPEGMGGGGSTYDYGFRIYNPQIGKFLSVDPLTGSYPELTPYQFASNSPIKFVDIDGLEAGEKPIHIPTPQIKNPSDATVYNRQNQYPQLASSGKAVSTTGIFVTGGLQAGVSVNGKGFKIDAGSKPLFAITGDGISGPKSNVTTKGFEIDVGVVGFSAGAVTEDQPSTIPTMFGDVRLPTTKSTTTASAEISVFGVTLYEKTTVTQKERLNSTGETISKKVTRGDAALNKVSKDRSYNVNSNGAEISIGIKVSANVDLEDVRSR